MKITKLRVSSYRGIAALETEIAPSGAIVKGRNGGGKTSVLRSIRAALAAQDISSDAIRQGSDKAEILVDLDDHTVRRVITAKGSTLTVEKNGMKASKPTTYLADLLGGAALDPLDLYLAKAKERKALILAALPVTVTREQLEKYAGDFELPLDFDTKGHGLEVVERARKYFYDERTAANKDAAEAKRTAERLAAEAQTAAQAVTPGPMLSAEQAKAAVAGAEREVLALEARVAEAASAEARTASQRAQIAQLRKVADEQAERFSGETIDTAPLDAAIEDAAAVVAGLRKQLAEAEADLSAARTKREEVARTNAILDAARVEIAAKRSQADAMESALAAAASAPPPAEEIETAQAKLREAKASAGRAELQAKAQAAVEAAEAAKKAAASMQAEADELDAVVKRLANDAPTELIAGAQRIPGLSIDGDEVLLDGKRLDALCGAEQLRFAVEIARRANAKTKILVCDGLERLDPDQMEAFVADATRDGWQLLATRVDRGDVVIEALEADATSAAAE